MSAGDYRYGRCEGAVGFIEILRLSLLHATRAARDARGLLAMMIVALLPAVAWSGEAAPTEQDPMQQQRAVRFSEPAALPGMSEPIHRRLGCRAGRRPSSPDT